jgi:amidase
MASDRRDDPSPPTASDGHDDELSRRSFLRWSALAGAGASLTGLPSAPQAAAQGVDLGDAKFSVKEATIAEMQAEMAAGRLHALGLTRRYLNRIEAIDRRGPGVNAVLAVNPDAEDIARDLDRERRTSGPRGPLHGIPIILKDNIDTGDGMMTTAGSLALVGAPALQDSTVAARLRAAGAVILGKANLSEWANFRGFSSSSGWSGLGGQCRNPYVLDRNPCGSSSGSSAAVAASLCAAALGTETDGSVVCPSSANNVVGIKPTVGLTSRAGVVPIAAAQDTVGTHGRMVADAAAVLGALTGVDPRDPATAASAGNSFTDYTQFVDPNGLAGARIGVARQLTGGITDETAAVFEAALQAMRDAGATVIDVAIPSFDEFANDISEIVVLVYEFKRDLNAYLATRAGVPVADMADVIAFNLANADDELLYFGQEWFELAQAEIFSEADYVNALATGPRLAGPEGIDAALAADNLDALVAPTNTPPWPTDLVNGDCFLFGSSSYAAVAGYPAISVPAGFTFGLPLGITLMAGAWQEPALIKVASGFEAATQARRAPEYLPTLELPRGAKRRRLDPGVMRKHFGFQVDAFLKGRIRRPHYL